MDAAALDAFIASLETDASRLQAELTLTDQRLAIARDLRATYTPELVRPPATGTPVEPVRLPKPPAEAKTTKPKSAPAVANDKRSPRPAPDYGPIAAAILEARSQGVPVGAFVAERFNVPKTTVTNWVTKCNNLSLLGTPPPAPKLAVVPEPKPVTPAATTASRTVYRCGSDDLEFPGIVDLTHHTLTAHDRRPTPGEKTLVTPDSERSSA